jgi:hypothetical protein
MTIKTILDVTVANEKRVCELFGGGASDDNIPKFILVVIVI